MSDDSTDGNVAESSKELPYTSNLLSGRSLLQIHVSTAKGLPKDGAKDFSPTNSWMEKKQVQCALDERKELLDEERVDKWSCLAGAVWNPKKKLAEVTRPAGKHFQTLGFVKDGTLYLYPEEALFMLETNSLELDFGGVSVSIQQGYSLLLGPSTGCELNEYRTYSHLMRQGYRLLRFTNQIVRTNYERTIRLDQHAPVRRNHPGQTGKNKESRSNKSSKIETMKVENHVTSAMEPVNKHSLSNREETPCTSEKSTNNVGNIPAVGSNSSEVQVSSIAVTNQGEKLELPQSTNREEDLLPSLINNIDSPQKTSENSSDPNIVESVIHDKYDETCDESGNQEPTADAEKSAVDKEAERRDAEKSYSGEKCEQSQQPDEVLQANGSDDGLRTKAYGIAETLLSMGSALVRNRPTEDPHSGDKTNSPGVLTATLQSEIMKMLGEQLDPGVSEEALATVASSAASTILSHVSNSENEETTAKIPDHENILESDKDDLDKIQSPEENSVVEAADSKCEDSLTMETFADPSSSIDSTNDVPLCTDSNDSNSVMVCPSNDNDGNENGAHFQNLKYQSTDSNDSGSIMVCSSNDSAEIGKGAGSAHLKRPVPSDETDQSSTSKKAKVVDEDIEILEYVPEKKKVELVDLSDESSMDTSHDSNINEAHSNSIEVIDVDDSSSNGSSEFTSSDSNDSSVILEERTSSYRAYSWNVERREILELIPNMYNLTEMTVKPPRSDLLPINVQPQRPLYHINRQRLVEDGRESSANTSHRLPVQEDHFGNSSRPSSGTPPNFVNQGPPVPFAVRGSMPQPYWPSQSGMPINPAEAVQAVARLVLPMLGLPPNVFPPEQIRMWVANNAWFPHRPWGPRRAGPWRPGPRGVGMGPRFNQHASRGNNFQRSRPRPYAHRRFARRYPHRGGVVGSGQNWQHSPHAHRGGGWGSSQNWQHSPRAQGQSHLATDDFPMNQVIPLQSTSRPPENDFEKTEGPSCWEQVKSVRSRMQGVGTRYFNPPKRYHHMHEVLDKNQIEDQMSDNTSESANSPNIKSESDSSDDDSTSENMVENENNSSFDNTDESCSSTTEVKPLLSPRECTDFESVFKSLQVIKEADAQSLVSTTYERRFKPQFDLFLPSKPFRKGNPPVPDFHLCIMRASDAVPAPGEIRVLMEALGDSVPVMFAVVSPDAISFFQFCDVSLPSVTGSC